MTFLLAAIPALLAALAVLGLSLRRREIARHATVASSRTEARARGSHTARLQYPDIDLRQCIGCGACVRACPEDGVLELLYGQAVVVHGARCVGHGRCAQACPTGAIALTLADLSARRDLPALQPGGEAVGMPGLFLAGEITGYALVRTAIAHGAAVATEVARRSRAVAPARARVLVGAGGPDVEETSPMLDLLIVGAGPAGLSCALQARRLGIPFLVIEQEARLGGAVAAYPRRKLVMTQPVELPLHGRLPRLSYQKEELIELWEGLATQHDLPVRTGVEWRGLTRSEDGTFLVQTNTGALHARHVCLALGRRGTPRRLGVPGEELPKVAYSLLDAESYRDRHVLVVGGGDSAVEAALALAEQPGNTVTVSYRREAFFRLKARNEQRVEAALRAGHLHAEFGSEVESISADSVRLRTTAGTRELRNDDLFVLAGGTPPFALLEQAGISFDPADRPATAPSVDRGGGLLAAFLVVLAGATALLGFALVHADYYGTPALLRTGHERHELLGPKGTVGLSAGLVAAALFVTNLLYLVRRSSWLGRLLPGSLRGWLGTHVATGLLALLFVLLHCALAPGDTVGGHALAALAVVVTTGAIGRWFYAFVPHRANGREAELEDVQAKLAALSGEWDQDGRGFGGRVRAEIEQLVTAHRWRHSLPGRIWALIGTQLGVGRRLRALRREARRSGIPPHETLRILTLAHRAQRLALMATHYDDLRALLASWRWLHRWLALLMVLLTILHVQAALRYAEVDWSVLPLIGGLWR